jgi:hypothetical protein
LKVALVGCLASLAIAQQTMDKQQAPLQQVKNVAAAGEPTAAESSSYGQKYRSGSSYGGSSYGGGVDPRYYDRGDTPHFGLAGFPFGCKEKDDVKLSIQSQKGLTEVKQEYKN